MWNASGASLPTVLIVENGKGNVFIVENNKTKKVESSPRRKSIRAESRAQSTIRQQEYKHEDELSIVEYLDYEALDENEEYEEVHVPFVDINFQIDEVSCTVENEANTDHEEEHESSTAEPTFDGRWSSDEGGENNGRDSDYLIPAKSLSTNKKNRQSQAAESRKHFWSHKSTSLQGKIGCKYCETVFRSRDQLTAHECKYLQCGPKNFICRICNKELSRKTFSNHLHETLDCHFCGKQFVNPRNMKAHLKMQHNFNEKLLPTKRESKTEEPTDVEVQEEKIRKPRKKEKLECDLCGKYLASHRSMSFHMSLHTGETSYICETCGEKFYTPNGIKNHSCEKKRRRPETDFRTYDHRYCRFCDTYFSSFDENKAHECAYQNPEDPKSVFCRCCGKTLAKWTFNRHMEIHSGVDWICNVCDRKVATERALKVHMTTHSGNKPYKCSLCTDSFISKVVLGRHMRFHGESAKVFRCEFCCKELSTETSLKSHVQRLHNSTVPCELCKKEFATREHLKEHLRTEHKPSICTVCNKTFTLPRYLKMHEKLHYDDDTPRVQCQVCSKYLGVKNIKSHVYRKHLNQFEAWCHVNPTL